MKILSFNKEYNNWYIDLPTWIGSKSALQMILGADVLLDILAEGKNTVTLNISLGEQVGYDVLVRQSYNLAGADYKYNDMDVWLCGVTIYVFGYFPKKIYFKKQ
jgi:hypothetical protein